MVHMRIYTNDGWILATTKEQARENRHQTRGQ